MPIDGDVLSADLIANRLRTTKGELAETIGLSADALSRRTRLESTKTQTRLRELWEILLRMEERTNGLLGAYAWVRSCGLEGYGERTPAQLIREGQASGLNAYLDQWFAGGYA
jgi:hypothetical protein